MLVTDHPFRPTVGSGKRPNPCLTCGEPAVLHSHADYGTGTVADPVCDCCGGTGRITVLEAPYDGLPGDEIEGRVDCRDCGGRRRFLVAERPEKRGKTVAKDRGSNKGSNRVTLVLEFDLVPGTFGHGLNPLPGHIMLSDLPEVHQKMARTADRAVVTYSVVQEGERVLKDRGA